MEEIKQQLDETQREQREILEQTMTRFQKLEDELNKNDLGDEEDDDRETEEEDRRETDNVMELIELNIYDNGAESNQQKRHLWNQNNLKSPD